MESLAKFAENQDEYYLVRDKIAKLCVSSPSLPTWPFRASGNVYTYDFLTALSPEFSAVLQYIASEVGDGNIEILGWGRGEAIEYFGVYPAFSIGVEDIEDAYRVAMRLNRDNSAGRYNVPDVMFEGIAIGGDSESWCLFGDRDWDVVLIWSRFPLDLESQVLKPMTFEDFLSPLRPSGPGNDHSIWRQLYANVRANSWNA